MKKENKKAYLIGSGIASLAAAAYLIRDGKFDGEDIYIFEESSDVGGSLDSKGSPENKFLARGERMFSRDVYNCTFDLLSFIPLEKNSEKTLLDDFIEFNNDKNAKWDAKARIIIDSKIADPKDIGLSLTDKADIIRMLLRPESSLEGLKISDIFSPSFFDTNYWAMFRTTFAFQPWHSAAELRRYALRFIQTFSDTAHMRTVVNTRYEQYDSMVLPILGWLREQGVNFLTKRKVLSLKFVPAEGCKERVGKIIYLEDGRETEIALGDDDLVFLTNGSMTTNSSLGNTKEAPAIKNDTPSDSWAIWKEIAKGRPAFGKPAVFDNGTDKTNWESFSVTFKDKTFSDLMEKFSGNKPGTGGLTTIKDSNWFISLITPHQPHFKDQPKNINFLWGYSLSPDAEGNFVHKKMSECTGEEILTEVCSHLGFTKELPEILASAECVPCMMPYITSQFMPRKAGDRPAVLPSGTANFAFIGQFCEVPDEIVFTVEQSVRSAIMAVRGLLRIKKEIPPIYRGYLDPKVMAEFTRRLLDVELENVFDVLNEEILNYLKKAEDNKLVKDLVKRAKNSEIQMKGEMEKIIGWMIEKAGKGKK